MDKRQKYIFWVYEASCLRYPRTPIETIRLLFAIPGNDYSSLSPEEFDELLTPDDIGPNDSYKTVVMAIDHEYKELFYFIMDELQLGTQVHLSALDYLLLKKISSCPDVTFFKYCFNQGGLTVTDARANNNELQESLCRSYGGSSHGIEKLKFLFDPNDVVGLTITDARQNNNGILRQSFTLDFPEMMRYLIYDIGLGSQDVLEAINADLYFFETFASQNAKDLLLFFQNDVNSGIKP